MSDNLLNDRMKNECTNEQLEIDLIVDKIMKNQLRFELQMVSKKW